MNPQPTAETRPCERFCPKCRQWKHHSRFRSFNTRHGRQSTLSAAGISFKQVCKACEQIEANELKNTDRALAIIQARAAARASTLGVPKSFLWVNMNWAALVPFMRALMGPDGRCPVCGHPFASERDIQIEHHEPPRHDQDWARHHSRNIGLACGSCNRTKGAKAFGEWLDEQEQARLSNDTHRRIVTVATVEPAQISLFDLS